MPTSTTKELEKASLGEGSNEIVGKERVQKKMTSSTTIEFERHP